MIKEITLLFSTVLILSDCKTKPPLDQRKELIAKFISATEKYDTTLLYALVDTSYYFHIQTKENFLFQIDYISSRLKACGDSIIDSSIKINDVAAYSKEYILPFCRGGNGEILFDSFDMHFMFADYENNDKIHFFDVVKYRRSITPTIAPPDQK